MEKTSYDFRVFLFALSGLCLAFNFISLVEAKELIIAEGNVVPHSGRGPAYWHVADQSKLPHSVKTSSPSDLKKIDINRDFGKKMLTMQGGTTLEARHMGTKFDSPVKSGTTIKASTFGRGLGRSIGVLGALDAGVQSLKIKKEMQKGDDLYIYSDDCLLYSATYSMFDMREGLLHPRCRVALKSDIEQPPVDDPVYVAGNGYYTAGNVEGRFDTLSEIKSAMIEVVVPLGYKSPFSFDFLDEQSYGYRYSFQGTDSTSGNLVHLTIVTYHGDNSCPVGSSWDGFGCLVDDYDPNPTYDWYPMTDELIGRVFEDLIDYDHPDLIDEIMNLSNDDIINSPVALDQVFAYYDEGILTLTNIPDSIKGDPVVSTTTISDSSGGSSTVVTETTPSANFSVDKDGLTVTYTQETNTYENGVKTGSSTTSTSQSPSGGSSVGPDSPPAPGIPTDCDLFPRACEYFDWMQEPPNIGGDGLDFGLEEGQFDLPDFDPGMYEVIVPEFAPAICPAPLVIDGGLFGEHEITYDYICEHAKDMRPFIRISALLFAIAIILGVSAKRR